MFTKSIYKLLFIMMLIFYSTLHLSIAMEEQTTLVTIQAQDQKTNEEFLNIERDIRAKLNWDSDETKKDVMGLLYMIPPQAKEQAIKKLQDELINKGYLKGDNSYEATEVKKVTKQEMMDMIKSVTPSYQHSEIDKYNETNEKSKIMEFHETNDSVSTFNNFLYKENN